MSKSFSNQLLDWYNVNQRVLPWRATRDPYKIWISEIMLQQTTVAAVIPYYQRWIKRYPTMETLARARGASVLKSWEGLGYYSRVRNIHAAAKIMVRDYAGQVPEDPKVLIKLPGFGPYTVGAVLSIAYNQRQPALDANVRRIMMRLQALEGQAESSLDKALLPLLWRLLPEQESGNFNQALMELGALICTQRPNCAQCPVCNFCEAYAQGRQESIPEPKKMRYIEIDVVVGLFRQKSRYYIRRRPATGILAGLWEFPSGIVEQGESHGIALERSMRSVCQATVVESQHAMQASHAYTNHRIKQHVYWCAAERDLIEDVTHRWVTLNQMQKFAMHSGSLKIADKLRKKNAGLQQA